MSNDPLIEQKEEAGADAGQQQRFVDLFDVRRVIGGLFGIYGLILVVMGLFASDADIDRAQGINSNLWVGLALLLTAAGFFGWALRAPIGAEIVDQDEERPSA